MSAPEDPIHIVLHGDSRLLLKTLLDDSIDSLVTDPPAGIAFMAKEWDDPDAWKYPVSQHGFTDGGERVPAPAIASSRNPNCRTCKRHKRGWKDTPGCTCEHPDFDQLDQRLADRDSFIVFLREILFEAFRVLKPGAHGVVWAIPRTSHWTATAIEEAGFEIRDCIYHVFGQGFPKSLNVGKAIDKMAGAEREVVGPYTTPEGGQELSTYNNWQDEKLRDGTQDRRVPMVTKPSTEDAQKWDGWGTSLKPAVECWWLVRKPIERQNVASQVLDTGTGAINIGATRVGGEDTRRLQYTANGIKQATCADDGQEAPIVEPTVVGSPAGRWPSNLVLSHSPGCVRVGSTTVKAPTINRFDDGMKPFGDGAGHPFTSSGGGTEERAVYECQPGCPVAAMDQQSGARRSAGDYPTSYSDSGGFTHGDIGKGVQGPLYDDKGGASRFFQTFEPQYDVPFFYTGKASKRDKNAGLEDMPERAQHELAEQTSSTQSNRRCRTCGQVKFGQPHCECKTPEWEETVGSKSANHHPTVKSQDLMQYLVRLVTPPGGIVLDPFAGSGSTLVAAVTEGMQFIGIEREDDYVKIAQRRVDAALKRTESKKFGEDLFELAMSMGDEE
jgi:site-specific DNA-methyltransferase (adenine-specific)